MRRSLVIGGALAVALLVVSCERAGRYGGRAKLPQLKLPTEAKEPTPTPTWRPARELPDVPIVFVHESAGEEWKKLTAFWNVLPLGTVAEVGTSASALPHLSAVAGMHFSRPVGVIKIRVPRGLPDPASFLPPGNPLTLNRWKLGKELFFDASIRIEPTARHFACSSCHVPATDFTERSAVADYLRYPLVGADAAPDTTRGRNTLSLVNSLYNKHQFWDGRVAGLEETIFGMLRQGLAGPKESAHTHAFLDWLHVIQQSELYKHRFKQVFGTDDPTPDTIARALATYMRTLLAGNSLFDRAAAQSPLKAKILTTGDFAAAFRALSDDERKLMGVQALADRIKKTENIDLVPEVDKAAERLANGFRLFTTSARCANCHPLNGLFTDHDFHNIGLLTDLHPDSRRLLPGIKEEGRITYVPVGRKELRLMGAYRTPGLRAVSRTGPYLHDGRMETLRPILVHFRNKDGNGVFPTDFTAPELLDRPGHARELPLGDRDIEDLILFLYALDGESVDPVLTRAQ